MKMSKRFEVKAYGPASNGWLYVTCDGERIADVRNQEAADALIAGLQGAKEPLIPVGSAEEADSGGESFEAQRPNDAHPEGCDCCACDEPELHKLRNCSACTPPNDSLLKHGVMTENLDRLRRALGLREGKHTADSVARIAIERLVLASQRTDSALFEMEPEPPSEPLVKMSLDAPYVPRARPLPKKGEWVAYAERLLDCIEDNVDENERIPLEGLTLAIVQLQHAVAKERLAQHQGAEPVPKTPEAQTLPTQEPSWQIAMRRATEAERHEQMNQAKDETLADELISRLNALIESPTVRADIARLIECRVPASAETVAHDTIQVTPEDSVGFLGVLNGIVGVIREGENAGAGYIGAEFDDNGVLARFVRTGVEAK